MQSNLLLYYQQFGGYPTNRSGPANNNTYGWQALVNTKIVDKLPSGATRDNNGNVTLDPGSSLYRYVSVGCPNGANTTVCASYVIWTQLETSNVALDSDADVYGRIETGTANNNLYTMFPFLSPTNPCNQPDSSGLFTGCGWLPQKPSLGVGAPNSNEECISKNANNNGVTSADCVFDLIP